MSPITDHPEVAYIGNGQWVLTDDLTYQSGYGNIVVPKGFRTDLDSVPRLPLAYLLTKNASVTAAILHDYLYQEGRINGFRITRKQADGVMYEVMAEEGVSWWQRRLIRFGLRVGGWIPWNRYREDDEPGFV